jgi:hypothetical protein
MPIEITAAIIAYSIAVAPDSSRMNVFRKLDMVVSLVTLERDATILAARV